MTIAKSIARLAAVCVVCGFVVACGSDKAVTGPSQITPPAPVTASVTSVSVTPPSGTTFIGGTSQLEAREALSDGTTRPASGASWSSDNTAVATVSPSGLVTAVAAGEATIAADAGSARGTLRIRVYPDFGGIWTGAEVLMKCDEAGEFAGICAELGGIGETFFHESTLLQNGEAVNAVIDLGDGMIATLTGTISVGGELGMGPASVPSADPLLKIDIENWRSRADTPSRMTGSYDAVLTATGLSGFLRMTLQLQNVVKSGAAPRSTRRGAATLHHLRRIESRLLQR